MAVVCSDICNNSENDAGKGYFGLREFKLKAIHVIYKLKWCKNKLD